MYKETDLVKIAKRENNNRRKYLVVNRLQGKHIPVSPREALALFDALAELVGGAYAGERLLLVGFAETATAIGARLAVKLGAAYIQTTRERIPGVSWLYFTESHSHATEQKLVREDMETALREADRVVFVEDEVTTGDTILKIIEILKEDLKCSVPFSVASLLNGMDEMSLQEYQKRRIAVHYLVKTDHSRYAEIADGYKGDGQYIKTGIDKNTEAAVNGEITECPDGYMNARRLIDGSAYDAACRSFWEQIKARADLNGARTALALGSEEFMYPALYAAAELEKTGCHVRFHATTRSPIAVSREEDYPLHTRYELESLYEDGRKTFIYDLIKYDKVIVLTDAQAGRQEGISSVLNALKMAGNEDIMFFRWGRE